MSKQCKICTDRHEKAGQELCPKCHRLSGLGFDRIVICTFHSERIPKRAERYLAQIELFRQEDREKSERLREEFARQLTVSDFRQGIKYCRSRSAVEGNHREFTGAQGVARRWFLGVVLNAKWKLKGY